MALGVLGVAVWGGVSSPAQWIVDYCGRLPLLVLVIAGTCTVVSIVCFGVHLLHRLDRGGLLSLLPPTMVKLLTRPPFEYVRVLVCSAVYAACNLLHVVFLVCLNLSEQQRKELLEGMDPSLRKILFQRSLLQSLPGPIQRLLLGRQAFADAVGRSEDMSQFELIPPPALYEAEVNASAPSNTQGVASGHDLTRAFLDESFGPVPKIAAAQLDVLRSVKMEGFLEATGAATTVSTFNHILREKAQASAVGAAKVIRGGVAGQMEKTCHYSRLRFSELREGFKEVASTLCARVVAACAFAGALCIGAGGAAVGAVIGGTIGVALGLLLAIFTFGLSIPIGAAMGATTGFCIGSTCGSATGLAAGGIAGFSVFQFMRPSSDMEPTASKLAVAVNKRDMVDEATTDEASSHQDEGTNSDTTASPPECGSSSSGSSACEPCHDLGDLTLEPLVK